MMDIRAGILTAIFLMIVFVVVMTWSGIQAIRSVRKIPYYRMKQDRLVHGWRLIGFSILLVGAAFWLGNYGEPTIYHFYAPSLTPSLTPTISMTPTITLTPTITMTPSITRTSAISDTPTITSTPFVPPAIQASFTSVVTPNPAWLFSQLVFARGVDLTTYQAVEPATVFENPIKRMVAIYSYDNMTDGVQWTALWYRDGTLINSETKPWVDGTGGYGYTDWAPDPSQWLPGNYEVQIFVGLEWAAVGRFTVQGTVPTVRPTPRPTFTPTVTKTLRPTFTPTMSKTFAPRFTPTQTQTRLPSATPLPSNTPAPSRTPVPTNTRPPTRTPTLSPVPTFTRTPRPSDTPWPILTPTITKTRTPTSTPRPTDTPWTSVPD